MMWMPDPHDTLNDEIRETAERLGVTPEDLITGYVRNGLWVDRSLELFPR